MLSPTKTFLVALLVLGIPSGLDSSIVSAAEKPTTEGTPLRIVAFNVEILRAPRVRAGQIQRYRFDHARTQHHERVANIIEILRPDILNLEEVTCRESVDLLLKILHEKGLTDYRGYHIENSDSYTGMDVALISRLEPDKVEGKQIRHFYSKADDPTWRQAYSFEGFDGSKGRGTSSISRNAVYFFTIGGHKLGFLGLHLKSNPSNARANAKRSAEAEVARRIVRGEIVSRGYLPIILGDLNDYDPDVPDRDNTRSTATKVLANLKNYDSKKKGDELTNVATLMPRVADRYSSHWDWNENGARDPQDVFTLIDHILLPTEMMPYVERAFIAHGLSLNTSDHFPVVVDLRLPAK